MFAIDHDRFSRILQSIQETCLARHLSLATAESCTGGLLAALLTHQSGSSAFYLGGVSTYANSAKTRLLQVETAMLDSYGAVSAEVAQKMAESTRQLLGSDFALSITGIAGPGGGSPGKPVGTVFCGWSTADGAGAQGFLFSGTREDVRAASCYEALAILHRLLGLI